MRKVIAALVIFIWTITTCVACGGSVDVNTENSETISSEQELEDVNTETEQKSVFDFDTTDLSEWFVDYNGEILQRIANDNSLGVTQREDIIYYRTEDDDIQIIVKTMLDAMIAPLMEKTDTRPYVILRYELDVVQPLKRINENVWILDIVSGYYEFEGVDFVDMETLLRDEVEPKDGMVRFFAQGSDAAFQYIIVREGNVYRLQKAQDMGVVAEH